MLNERASGILLHPTCLPGPYGIGDFGSEAYNFVDWLDAAGQRYWQVLPLVPPDGGGSPYNSISTFAGSPLFISPERLKEDGWIEQTDLDSRPDFGGRVDYANVGKWKSALLAKAWAKFEKSAGDDSFSDYEDFCAKQVSWLDDFALFTALREKFERKAWVDWDEPLARRDHAAMERARRELLDEISVVRFGQYQFFRQWEALKAYCNDRKIEIIGDIPIYVSYDSADVWANPELYHLDEDGRPTVVAGVPPDYFSDTGQLWGNPIYRWDKMKAAGFPWWINRVRSALNLYDIVRIDHFRGFESYWEVPAEEETAINGRWVDAPGDELFNAIREALGDQLPIIAENLGVITEEVEALRERHELPGMAVLHFGFGHDAKSSYFPPHTFTQNLVAYTGTHDNDTTVSWWEELAHAYPASRKYIERYFILDRDFNWAIMRALMASVANTVIFPLQDVLGLGNEARLNKPGTATDRNWTWRMSREHLPEGAALGLREFSELFGRNMTREDEAGEEAAAAAAEER